MGSVVDDDEARKDVGVREGSVLFVSAHITPDHDNYGMYRPNIDPPPDVDLNRLLDMVKLAKSDDLRRDIKAYFQLDG